MRYVTGTCCSSLPVHLVRTIYQFGVVLFAYHLHSYEITHYEIRGFTSVQMTITVNYTYSVEHNTRLFKIELSLDM